LHMIQIHKMSSGKVGLKDWAEVFAGE
jgi:hypothetical protein